MLVRAAAVSQEFQNDADELVRWSP